MSQSPETFRIPLFDAKKMLLTRNFVVSEPRKILLTVYGNF